VRTAAPDELARLLGLKLVEETQEVLGAVESGRQMEVLDELADLQTVIEAMHLAFGEGREISEADLIAAASQVVPLSRTAREQLEALRQWASSGRARSAAGPPNAAAI
jgi:predicted house-cleaning noncanonical NTP pyrophosphatase (MazG superfamily)